MYFSWTAQRRDPPRAGVHRPGSVAGGSPRTGDRASCASPTARRPSASVSLCRAADGPADQSTLLLPPGGIVRSWSPPRGRLCRTSRPGSAARPRSGASRRRRCWLARYRSASAHSCFPPSSGSRMVSPRRLYSRAARFRSIRSFCSSSSNSRPGPFDRPSPDLAWRCHPVLTGLPTQQRYALIAALMTPHDQQRETSLDKRRGDRPRRRPPARPHPGRPPPGHHPAPAPCPAPDRHCRLVRRPAGDGQQAHPRHPPASWTRPGTPSSPARTGSPAWKTSPNGRRRRHPRPAIDQDSVLMICKPWHGGVRVNAGRDGGAPGREPYGGAGAAADVDHPVGGRQLRGIGDRTHPRAVPRGHPQRGDDLVSPPGDSRSGPLRVCPARRWSPSFRPHDHHRTAMRITTRMAIPGKDARPTQQACRANPGHGSSTRRSGAVFRQVPHIQVE
jgi:hypothetical protein